MRRAEKLPITRRGITAPELDPVRYRHQTEAAVLGRVESQIRSTRRSPHLGMKTPVAKLLRSHPPRAVAEMCQHAEGATNCCSKRVPVARTGVDDPSTKRQSRLPTVVEADRRAGQCIPVATCYSRSLLHVPDVSSRGPTGAAARRARSSAAVSSGPTQRPRIASDNKDTPHHILREAQRTRMVVESS